MNNRFRRLAWLSLLGGVAAAEILIAGALYAMGAHATGAQQAFAIVSLCRGFLGLSAPDFYSELQTANLRMHQNMDIATSGNPDRDFAQMMMAHHQGAIDMALVQLKYGRDVALRRLAQSIIVEQDQEITYMRTLISAQPATLAGRGQTTGTLESSNE